MYKLTDSKGNEYGIFETEDDAYRKLRIEIDKLKFKSYYHRRILDSETRTTIDYGSHSHFFHIDEIK